MPVAVSCPSCKTRVRLPDHSAGRNFRCPKCKGVIPGQGEAAAPNHPVVRPVDVFDPGFVDAPDDPTASQPIDRPLPISSAAREATRESYNPFADGTDEDEDETPRKKRYFQPKDNYNPFAEEPAAQSSGGNASPEEVFDFGMPETSEALPSPGDFDFGSGNGDGDGGPRKRRR